MDDQSTRRIHVLLSVRRYARLMSSPVVASGADDMKKLKDFDSNAAVMTDRRIVRVTGPLVHSDILGKVLWFVAEKFRGLHVKTIPTVTDGSYGVAVNPSETLMAVTCFKDQPHGNKLYVHSLPGGELLRTIGGRGFLRGKFGGPARVCFGPDDTIIVADRDNNRLQEFTSTGQYKRSIAVEGPWSVSISRDGRMIGVGTIENGFSMHNYATGKATFGVEGKSALGYMTVACFAGYVGEDVKTVLATSWQSSDVRLLTVTGENIRAKVVCGGLAHGCKDVVVAPDGDIFVADEGAHRISVFDPEGRHIKLQFGSYGAGDGQFGYPNAIALVNGRLYVVDHASARVQVFE